jgi:hypothetical protein
MIRIAVEFIYKCYLFEDTFQVLRLFGVERDVELERTRKGALLQYLTTGNEEILQTLGRMASFLTRYRKLDWIGPCSKFS